MNAPPRVSVIIPTWNGRALLADCLDALAAQDTPPFETIVVDDGSTDGVAAWLESAHPGVRCIRLPENRGFAAAVNAGLTQARGEWRLLLNNDVTLAPDFLTRMLDAARNSGAAIIAPCLYWRGNPDLIYSAGDGLTRGLKPYPLGFRAAAADYTPPESIWGASMAAGLFHQDVFDQAGMLDEAFGAYFEDADLCTRARLLGFDAALAHAAKAWHVGSASIQHMTWWRARQCYRNHALFVLKNAPLPLLARHALPLLRERARQAAACFSAARAAFGARRALFILLAAALSLLPRLPGALAARWRIQRGRVCSARTLASRLQDP